MTARLMGETMERIASMERWMGTIALVVLAFLLGWLAGGGPTVHAQGGSPQVELRDGNLYAFYPEQDTLYIYNGPLAGGPQSSCIYKLVLSGPGGKVTRQQCPYNP
jgi:hypothetical protein